MRPDGRSNFERQLAPEAEALAEGGVGTGNARARRGRNYLIHKHPSRLVMVVWIDTRTVDGTRIQSSS